MNRYLKGVVIAVFILFGCYQQAFSQEGTGSEAVENLSFQTGIASWYGPGLHQNLTAQGEAFDMNELTAAHPTLPFDTLVRVTNLKNKKSVIVRINDRGPFIKNRVIDLSREAARRLEMLHSGLARVKVEVLNDE